MPQIYPYVCVLGYIRCCYCSYLPKHQKQPNVRCVCVCLCIRIDICTISLTLKTTIPLGPHGPMGQLPKQAAAAQKTQHIYKPYMYSYYWEVYTTQCVCVVYV